MTDKDLNAFLFDFLLKATDAISQLDTNALEELCLETRDKLAIHNAGL